MGDLHEGRSYHTATLLQDGRVLVVGGWVFTAPIASVEIYDPAARTWSAGAPMASARCYHSDSLLADGRVLVMGGRQSDAIAATESYDPSTNAWISLPAMPTERYSFGMTKLVDGRVLVAGGFGILGEFVAKTELFNPVAQTWSAAGDLGTAHAGHSLTRLPDGRVLVVGGYFSSSVRATAAADLLNPGNGVRDGGNLSASPKGAHPAYGDAAEQRAGDGGGRLGCERQRTDESAELYDPTRVPVASALQVVRSSETSSQMVARPISVR